MIVQVGVYPKPIGGISVYIKRMKEYMDLLNIPNEVWDISGTKKSEINVVNIKLKYVPIKFLFQKNIDLIHYNICGVKAKNYIGLFNRLFFKNRKKILTIHGECKELFQKNNKRLVNSLNSFNAIICVKSGDKDYLIKKGITCKVYEIPAFIKPIEKEENIQIPKYITDFIKKENFIITANASSLSFCNNEDLYGVDMCVELLNKLKNKYKNIKIGFVFCLSDIGNYKYFKKIKEDLKKLNLEKDFLFVKDNIELYPIMKMSDLFIRPTNTDGDAVSVREALFYKIPVITSDVVKRPEGTILFKTRDFEDLYNKTLQVIENYQSHKSSIENIIVEDNAKKLMDIYETLKVAL